MQDKTTLEISDTFREYIEALVEEVVINGEPFEAQKKWLRKNSEAEGVSFETIESNLNDFFEAIKELEEHESKSTERFARNLAQSCYFSETEVDKLIDNAAAVRVKKEAERKAQEEKEREVQEDAKRKAKEEADYKKRKQTEDERKAKEEAERKAQEQAERKAREEAEQKAKEDTDRVEFLRCSEEAWNSVPLLRCPLKYILLDKQTMSVAIAMDRRDERKPKEITIPSTFTDYRIHICFNVTSIYDYAFMECDWLESITIPSSVKSVGRLAFLNCRNLSRIDVQGEALFVSRDSFENTPFANSPAYAEAINKGKIVVTSETNRIKLPDRIPPYLKMYDFSSNCIFPDTHPIIITPPEIVIPAKVGNTIINSVSGFKECDTVRSIIFRSRPNLVIDCEAFLCCRNLESVVFEPIEHLTIQRNAFAFCSKFSSLTFEFPYDESAHIVSDAFMGCNLPLKKRMELRNMERKYAKTHWTN
jgi:hypothetical protein